jgi:hypothetical protein
MAWLVATIMRAQEQWKNEATVKEDTSIEFQNIAEKTNYTLDLF